MRCDILRWWVGRVEVVCLYTVRPPLPVGWQGPPGWLTAAGGPPPPAGRRWPPPWRPVFVRGAVGSRRSARPGRPSVRPRPRGGGRQRDSRPPSPANSARMLARGRLRGCPAEWAPRHGSRAASARGPASPWVWSSSVCGRLGVRRGRSRRARSSWTRLRPGERALAYMNAARRHVHPSDSAFTWVAARSPALRRVHLGGSAFTPAGRAVPLSPPGLREGCSVATARSRRWRARPGCGGACAPSSSLPEVSPMVAPLRILVPWISDP